MKTKQIYDEELRVCDICHVKMLDGYCFDGGSYYACCDEHRDKIAIEQYDTLWEDLYTDDGDFYYTTWYDYDRETLHKLFDMIDESIEKKNK